MRYWKVRWHHEFAEEPIAIYSEIGPDDYETRRVEEFGDGRLGWADQDREHGGTSLAYTEFGDIEEVREQPEFSALVITEREFDAVWRRAVESS
ncbi:DUF6881 domain-containing protein [Streptomyces hainanensis]|uniref:DUF6881 domain-containing protein n=1 Tax=Streptomyces hainanensis TaxID=402648 RepID=A0A4R4TIR7_9ACTN|nr:hypothetical protein [Streptomyces hainanensis]TDC77738.1 hypothetical protein E1283_06550 [Streptomyces hainanensis]